MILFFNTPDKCYAVDKASPLSEEELAKLLWLFGDAIYLNEDSIPGTFIGPRREMITPWSTNAVEITQNMGIMGIRRIEQFSKHEVRSTKYDRMLEQVYKGLDQYIFSIEHQPDPVLFIHDISEYNQKEGLALSIEEINFLNDPSIKLGRKLTDSEVFGFSQVNSEHCRHKIFNGTFIIDSIEQAESLFALIRKTSKVNSNRLVSAYKDNVAFFKGPVIVQFAPKSPDKPDYFQLTDIETVLSLKAETHNFPTTVEPFNGAATGSGGEIRDRMAGGKASIPLAGTAVYMTSYSRLEPGQPFEQNIPARPWLYHAPEEILIRASNGASDFGNKFGQPLICGSVLTFEHHENGKIFAFDKVIMLAGGIGFARVSDSLKETPEPGQKIIVMGGDNYRIGMGGSAVSSVATGEYSNAIELNAVQRSNPEMQKRVFNTLRAMAEVERNPIVSIHDHGAGGHLNCLSELMEATGGEIDMGKLPLGDPTLSDKEIIGNESQERMGLIVNNKDVDFLRSVADRERAPLYEVGKTTDDHQLVFCNKEKQTSPIHLPLEAMFHSPPKTIITDQTVDQVFLNPTYEIDQFESYLSYVLQLEAVACKDWLTNKVDRAVSGKIAMQQTCGEIQLPLNNLGAVALDYSGEKGIATAIGHAPAAMLINRTKGSRLAITEALTNIIWAPLQDGLQGISLSANWMWPCKNPGEDARLYEAVKALSDFAIELGINIPTGKDSLSMTQKYPDGQVVYAPGTVIISAAAEVIDVKKIVSPVIRHAKDTVLLYIDLSGDSYSLGGSSFAQVVNSLGSDCPDVCQSGYLIKVFREIQDLIVQGQILAGHDISAGGMITTLLEMTFPNTLGGIVADLSGLMAKDMIHLLFAENPGIIIQTKKEDCVKELLQAKGISALEIGYPQADRRVQIKLKGQMMDLDIDAWRDAWYRTSYLLDRKQSGEDLALRRFLNFKSQPLQISFSRSFSGKADTYGVDLNRKNPSGIRAAVIREKGVNRDRDMAWALYLAGFDVKDVHMTDLISGRETLEDIHFIAFAGGFSNSDVLGSAKGWAGAFLYNPKAREALDRFYQRKDTLSLGVCNGCQLMVELGVLYPEHEKQPWMSWNDSHKYECAFINLTIFENNSVMLHSLAGSRLGVWSAHGEGKFNFPLEESKYHIPAKFSYHEYPGNPNGSMFDAACIASADGRHLAIMPHIEDSVLPWQWAHYPSIREDEITPWVEAFVNARNWIATQL